MPVRLDTLPSLADFPARPRIWIWLLALLVTLVLGLGLSFAFHEAARHEQPVVFWGAALGAPVAVWCFGLLLRLLVHINGVGAAEGWNDERERDLLSRLRSGRRSQQILAVSLFTALSQDDETSAQEQTEALRGGAVALHSQPLRENANVSTRHSQLPRIEGEQHAQLTGEPVLQHLYLRVLLELAKPLAACLANQPVALLLETATTLSDEQQRRAWQTAWEESGIRQQAERLQGSGLAVVDRWLDTRISDQSLLMVVSVQLASAGREDMAEAAVGLLFGNRLTQRMLEPIAVLHRPEQERAVNAGDLRYSIGQALEWATLPVSAIEHVWLSGIDAQRQSDLTCALLETPLTVKPRQGLYDLDSALGHAGPAAPWVAVAAAAQALGATDRPQFIISGESAASAGLWNSVVSAVPKREV